MRRPTLPSLPSADRESKNHDPRSTIFEQALSVCEGHLEREEALLADMLLVLRAVRDAFFQRDLTILATLQSRQEQLRRTSQEIALARDRLRESLAVLLGIPPAEVTLRRVADSLRESECARDRLLRRHARLVEMVREADQLSRHNAALLGYARGFLDCLFAGVTGSRVSERYGPQGERRAVCYGPFLEARA